MGGIEERVEALGRDGDAFFTVQAAHALPPGQAIGVERPAEIEQHRAAAGEHTRLQAGEPGSSGRLAAIHGER
jgi:hypothetical protein